MEYFGGILDVTGEINRYGIQQATKRNLPGVLQCLEVVSRVQSEAMQMQLEDGSGDSHSRNQSGMKQKMNTLKATVRKLQGVYLELALRQASGWSTSSSTIGGDEQGGDDQN